MTTPRIPCPKCSADLADVGELDLVGTVPAAIDPEGKLRLDIVFDCHECGARFNTFVAMDKFVEVEV